jgi:ABC-type transporter lipoprotein component MlaA
LGPRRHLGLKRQGADFGQTLGHYGVGNGLYIV